MDSKELEKQNFLLWYSVYATEKELEMARTVYKGTLDKLLKEYAEEIDKIDKTRRLYKGIFQSKKMQTQYFDAALKIESG
ncbi:MAG: hypothetical protein NG784_05675 [Candidatus Jettenia sp.]|nr:hypothetical protein [Candidatus Jettenia sp.]